MRNAPYQWIPGNGMSLEAVERMRRHFPRPAEPMGEAWFMGDDRRIYTELIDLPFEQIKGMDLTTNILFEIASGTKSFGHYQEWDDWFKYLLPRLILRSNERIAFREQMAEAIVTAFMSIYWKEITEEYSGFRNDVIDSLALCLMNESQWEERFDDLIERSYPKARFLDIYLDGQNNPRLNWNSGHADNTFSALMFFCLKYLQPAEIESWTQSLFQIEDPYWKGAFAVWLVAAFELLKQPVVTPNMIEEANPELDWENSHCLGSRYGSIDAEHSPHADYNDNKDFLPAKNIEAFLTEVKRNLTDELIIEWAEVFTRDEFIANSTSNIPELLLRQVAR